MSNYEVHLRIEAPKLQGRHAKVFLNGEDISSRVVAINVDWRCDDLNRVSIEFLADSLVIDSVVLAEKRSSR